MTSSSQLDNLETLPLLPRVVSSSVGAILTALVVQPLEVIKVRQQALNAGRTTPSTTVSTSSSIFRCLECGTFVLDTSTNGSTGGYRGVILGEIPSVEAVRPRINQGTTSLGTIRTSQTIFRSHGIAGFYAGLYPSLIMSVPNTVTYFSCYDEVVTRMKQWRRRRLQRYHDSSDNNVISFDSKENYYYDQILTPLVGGMVARIFATMVTSPLELIRTRQASNASSQSMMSELRSVLHSSNSTRNHLAALYKGLGPTLWRDVPFSAIYWVGVETLKTDVFHFHRHESSSVLNQMASSFASGALSGMIAATCTTPFDVIKTRSQVASSSQTWKKKKLYPEPDFTCSHHQGRESIFYPSERNIFYQLRHIAKTEGLGTLWSGNVARVLKIGPACAIMLTSYEYSKSIISGMQ